MEGNTVIMTGTDKLTLERWAKELGLSEERIKRILFILSWKELIKKQQ